MDQGPGAGIGSGGMPLFCDTALAGRIERAEAQLMARAAEAAHRRGAAGPGGAGSPGGASLPRTAGAVGFVSPVAGGVASFAEEGSPFNKVAGLGFGGVPSAAALAEVERAFAGRRRPSPRHPTGTSARGVPARSPRRRRARFRALRRQALRRAARRDPGRRSQLPRRRRHRAVHRRGDCARAPPAGVSRPRCCRPGSPTPRQPAATWR